MSSARKCDRCGVYHDGRLVQITIEPIDFLNDDKEYLDLCQDCYAEFTDFMNGVKPKDLLGRLQALFK